MPDSSATLRVLVTTARGAVPVADALVTVSTPPDQNGERALLYSVRTDASGMSPPLTLSTPPRELSLAPAGTRPFALYTVQVEHPNYAPQTALNISMFSGVPAVLPVSLEPHAENGTPAPPKMTATPDPQVLFEQE